MAYIGAEPLPGQNREVDDISSGFNGNATAFTLQVNGLNVSPETANNILVNLGGVIQNPGTDYTIAASTLTFTTAPASGLSFFAIILGAGINTATVADQTIGTSKVLDNAITADKLAHTSVTAGSYTTADITVDAQGRITAAASGSISNAEIANNAVTTAKIADSTGASDGVTTAKLATDAVTAAKLADNAVVNASVDSSAAIAGSKISPDFGSQNIATGGDITITSATPTLKLMDSSTNPDYSVSNNNGVYRIRDLTNLTNPFLISTSEISLDRDLSIADTIVHTSDTNTKIRFPANDTVSVETAGSERLRVDSSGNLVLGHNSAAAKLHVYSSQHYVVTDSGKATNGIHVRGSNGNAGEYGGAISFSCGDGNSSSAIAVSQEAADADVTGLGFFIHESSNGADDAVERLRLNNKGLIQAKGRAGSYFGTVNTNESHVFNNTGNAIFLMQLHQEHHNGHCLRLRVGANNNNEAMDMVDYSASGAQRFKIANDGDVTNQNNSYGSLSDISLKENIVDAKSQWDDIKAIKVRNFNFKETPDKKLLGVVAQEIETVCSGLVTEGNVKDPDDTTKITGTVKNVKYSVLYMKAIKALQEAITRIETLETEVAALKAA